MSWRQRLLRLCCDMRYEMNPLDVDVVRFVLLCVGEEVEMIGEGQEVESPERCCWLESQRPEKSEVKRRCITDS